MSEVRFVTLCTRSRLAEAAVLARSLDAVHPGVPRLLVLVERDAQISDRACGWEVLPVDSLALPGGARFLFQYAPFELCCALKPYVLEAALALPGTRGAVYLDGDMLALAPFLDLIEAAWREADVWLTPHLHTLAPAPDFSPFLHAGAYNAGFLAVLDKPAGRFFLRWFRERLEKECIRDFRRGIFDDQKWLDLAAATCPGVRSLGSPGLNAGHWNLHEHRFDERADGSLWLNGAVPLSLFHFSGLAADALTRHGSAQPPPAIQSLAARYRQSLAVQRSLFPAEAFYSLGRFADGTPILPPHREAVRLGKTRVADPFLARGEVEAASAGLMPPVADGEEALEADAALRRLRAHPVIGRVWRFWKTWVNNDLP